MFDVHYNITPAREPRGPAIQPEWSIQQLSTFVLESGLYHPKDLIEIRAVNKSGVSPQVHDRFWATPQQLIAKWQHLRAHNASQCEIYQGVHPRAVRASSARAVRTCRSVHADLDNCSVDEAAHRWKAAGLPEPSVTVSSGHGAHLYWVLASPCMVWSAPYKASFERMLRQVHAAIGGDHTASVAQLLRLPGFVNHRAPVAACELVSAPGHKYPLHVFHRFFVAAKAQRQKDEQAARERQQRLNMEAKRDHNVSHWALDIANELDRPREDRSARDFWVVCSLVRLGLSDDAIRRLVSGRSKFEREDYTELTLRKAREQVGK